MSKANSKKVSMNINKLTVDTSFNNRLKSRYDLPSIMAGIVDKGRIVTPIVASKRADGTFLTLQGNRRTLGGQALLADPNISPELREALSKTDVLVFEGLTTGEEIEMMMDHGTTLSLCRTETAMGVRRLLMMGKSEKVIGQMMVYALAKFTRNEAKLNQLPKEPGKARDEALSTWFAGTLRQYLMPVCGMGQYVWDQFILTMKSEDGILEPERKEGTITVPAEVIECRMTRKRIMALGKAKSEDMKSENKWSVEEGGDSFNKLVQDYILEDKGEKDKEKVTRPSVKDLLAKADAFGSLIARKCFLVAAGQEEQGEDLPMLDDRLKRMSAVFSLMHNASLLMPAGSDIRNLLNAVLSDGPVVEVEAALAPFVTKAAE